MPAALRPPGQLLPYRPRPGQEELVAAARMAFLEGRHALIEAGTGTGKTVAVLAAALDAADRLDRHVLYLTRTNSQQRQAIREARALLGTPGAGEASAAALASSEVMAENEVRGIHDGAAAQAGAGSDGCGAAADPHGRLAVFPTVAGEPPIAIALQGRAHLCPELRNDPRYAQGTADEYARLCAAKKRASLEARRLRSLAEAWPGWRHRDAEGLEETTDGAAPHRGNDPGAASAPHPTDARVRLPMADKGCPYYDGLIEEDPERLRAFFAERPRAAEELGPALADRGVCPYEAAKVMLHRARLVVAPYIYAADPSLRGALEEWLGAPLSRCVIVVDEAHNLPDYLKALHSPRLGLETLRRARSEAEAQGDPPLLDGLRTLPFLDVVEEALVELAETHIPPPGAGPGETEHGAGRSSSDARLPPGALQEELLVRLGRPSRAIDAAVHVLHGIGEDVRAREQAAGRLPRSYLGAVASFLAAWARAEPDEHVPLVLVDEEPGTRRESQVPGAAVVPATEVSPQPVQRRLVPGSRGRRTAATTRTNGADPALLLHCVDPSLGARFLHESHASVHISGTLRPMEQYRDVLGLPSDTLTLELPSPFPPEHLRLILVDDVTTRYEVRRQDPAVMSRLHDHLHDFVACRGANGAVFFSGHQMLRDTLESGLEAAPGQDTESRRRLYVEVQGQSQAALMRTLERFTEDGEATRRGGRGAVLLGVMGGRIAEGIDFPGRSLEAMALVGMPYPKPTARLEADIHYNEIRFGRGWEYAVHAPVVRRVLQAIGRIIRDEDDRGIVFLLDERFRRMAAHLPRLERLGDEEGLADAFEAWLTEVRGDEAPAPTPRAGAGT